MKFRYILLLFIVVLLHACNSSQPVARRVEKTSVLTTRVEQDTLFVTEKAQVTASISLDELCPKLIKDSFVEPLKQKGPSSKQPTRDAPPEQEKVPNTFNQEKQGNATATLYEKNGKLHCKAECDTINLYATWHNSLTEIKTEIIITPEPIVIIEKYVPWYIRLFAVIGVVAFICIGLPLVLKLIIKLIKPF